MKKKFITTFLISMVFTLMSGCGANGTNNTSRITDSTKPSGSTATVSESTTPVAVNTVQEVILQGEYDSIFNNEIKTHSDSDPHIVISGHDFAIDSSSYVLYFEGIGPVVILGEQLQYKIKIQDKTFDEVKASDVTAKAVAAGYEIKAGPEMVNENDLEYIWFSYDTGMERGVAVNMPGPSKEHAMGVQIAILDDSVTDKEAISSALTVVKTASLTGASDSTKEDIDKLYSSTNSVSGVQLDSYTIKFGKSSYTHPVPKGFYKNYEDTDEDGFFALYDSSDIDVTVTYKKNESFTDSTNYIDNMLMWALGEVKDKNEIGDVSYALLYDKDYHCYELISARIVDGYIFCVTAECDSEVRKISFEDIKGFYVQEDDTPLEETSTAIGPRTGIKHDQLYAGSVPDEKTALNLITQYGEMQRERYDNTVVADIEKRLQQDYSIASVNLGEIDLETAKDIEQGIRYMFDTYPVMKGSLNTFSLANLQGREGGYIALTQTVDFIVENDEGIPKVVRNEIILNANKWLSKDQMMDMCKENVESGYWCKNADNPSKIIVHELGHQLLNVIRAKEYGFVSSLDTNVYMPTLLTEANKESYLQYYWAGTALNQEIEKQLMADAYDAWKSSGNKGSEEDFRLSISKYANGIKSDGGISFHETFAEAVADVYCNGENASAASKAIMEQAMIKLNR